MKRLFAVYLITCLLFIVAPIYAQSNPFPLLVTADLDDATRIYTFENGTYSRLDTGDFKSYYPDYAPEGMKFVYLRWSPITVDFANQMIAENGNFAYYGEVPNDVVIYNLETGENTVIASQPADVNVETLINSVHHSAPKWSPDGTMIAWSEFTSVMDENNQLVYINKLMIYDLATSEIRVSTDLPTLFSAFPASVEWGTNGVYVYIFNQDTPEPEEIFMLFSANGDPLFDIRVPIDFSNYVTSFAPFVAEDGDREVFAIYYPSGLLKLIDNTGAIEEVVGAGPQKYNRLAPNGVANIMMPADGNAMSFYVTNPTTFLQEFLLGSVFTTDFVSVSPDGASAVYLDLQTNVATLWHDMTVTPIEPPLNDLGEPVYIVSMTWGNQAIRIIRS